MSTTTTVPLAGERITAEVTSWPGVTAETGSRGELGFAIGRRPLGHLHGDRVAHFGFPRTLWAQLLEQRRIERHPIDHDGWGARPIRSEEDIADVVALLRLNYDRIVARYGVPD